MLIRIVRARAKPGMWADFEREFFLAGSRRRSAPGLRTLWILHDLDDVESGFVVAFWDGLDSALDFERRAEQSELLDHPLPGDMEFHLCELRSVWIRPA
jgi:heme-degrading monooxygenase HmoA